MSYISRYIESQAKANISLSVCQSGWQQSNPSHFYGPMVRDYYVIHYIVKGKGYYHVNGQVHQIGAKDGFLILPGDSTYYEADKHDPWEYYWVGFVGNDADRLLTQSGLGKKNLVFSYTEDDMFEQHIANIFYESKRYSARNIAMIGYLYLLFSLLINNPRTINVYHQQYMDNAMNYIDINYAKDITVEQIAKNIGVSRSHLYRVFQENLGISVKEYIDAVRLSKARDLLTSAPLSITEISTKVGFSSSSHFSKKFKDVFGETPSSYRKANRQD